LGLVVVASGCPSRDISSLGHGDNGEILNDVNVVTNRNVDILFLIDNSSSMNDKQDLVAANFPRFIDVLNNIPGGAPNVHIGVASSTVSVGPYAIDACTLPDDGLLQNTPRVCSTAGKTCRFSSECCSNSCVTGMCASGPRPAGCHVPGATCNGPNDCCTHQCQAGICGCPVPNAGARYIEDIANPDGSRKRNYDPSVALADVFTCIARLGVSGC